MAQLVLEDGNATAYILNLDDAYGNGIGDIVEAVLTASGVEVLGHIAYDPTAASYDAEVGEVVAADPDAIVLISFDEGSRILRTMVENGIGPTVEERLRHRRQHGQRARRELRRRDLIPTTEYMEEPRGDPGLFRLFGSAAGGLGQRAEVQLDHRRIRQQVAAGAGVGVPALIEHVAAVHHLQAAAGVLLDHQDRDARSR